MPARCFFAVPLLVILGLSSLALSQGSQIHSGMYSHSATAVWERIAGGRVAPLVVHSPDGRSSVEATDVPDSTSGDDHVFLDVSGALGRLHVTLGPGVGSELLWAPDSHAFFVTTSDEGANGSYRLLIVGDFSGRLESRDVTSLIYKTFGHPVRCGWPEVPNVGGVGWLRGTRNILVAAEIVNHSNCDSFGTFRVYEVDPEKMSVIKSYGQLEAKQKFGDFLGDELKAAPDICIRDPKSCYVSTNHGG
jgi:hypothetical protein